MNTERIERALREGPPDEPMYVPGGHRQAVNRNLLAAVAGVALAAALVIGVVVGVTLDTLRGPSGGVGAPNVEALAAELEGMWTSEATTPDAWVEGLLALGYAREDVELALGNFPPYERARWQLVFADEHLQIFGSFDGGPWIGLSGGPYELLPDGSIYYDDIGCFITIRFDVEDDRLAFAPMRTESCNADESLNNAGFFMLVNYVRAASE